MWTCPLCNQSFKNKNQQHSCVDKLLQDFLNGKSEHTISLFHYFIEQYNRIGKITVHPTKTMIALAAKKRMVYITQLGKNFVHIVFPFDKPYHDNLCFQKIAQVPGTQQFNHHFRMYLKEDINEEVISYMKLAYTENAA
jgi:hypothetical protein